MEAIMFGGDRIKLVQKTELVNTTLGKKTEHQVQSAESGEFLIRLKQLARGRPLTPWLVGCGWSKVDVSNVIHGHIPGHLKLTALALREDVSLTWLLTGKGPPYVGQGGWVAAEPTPLPPPRRGLRGELVSRVDALSDDSVRALVRTARLLK